MRKSITSAGLCLSLCCSSAADAIQPKDASYFCVAEAAGGLSFNSAQKKWVGTVFRADEKFVLRLKFVDVQPGTEVWDKEETYTNFDVSITASGSSYQAECRQRGSGKNKSISISSYGSFTCSASLQDYYFNLENNRYMNFYAAGYINGADNNENTPSVTGGVCTKIN